MTANTTPEGAQDIKAVLLKGDQPIIVSGPPGCGKSYTIRSVLASIGKHDLHIIDLNLMQPEQRANLIALAKMSQFDGLRRVWWFPNIDKIDKRFLATLAKIVQKTKSITLIMETTQSKELVGEVRSYCRFIPLTKPALSEIRKAAGNITLDFVPRDFHEVETGTQGFLEVSDFEKITRFFDGKSRINVNQQFGYWVTHNARGMLQPYDQIRLYHYISSLARHDRLDMASILKFSGSGRPEFPYFLRKRSLKKKDAEP